MHLNVILVYQQNIMILGRYAKISTEKHYQLFFNGQNFICTKKRRKKLHQVVAPLLEL